MENSNRLIEEIIEKWEEDFTFLYGSEDPTRTFKDHDDFLIIKNNTKAHLRSSLEKVRQETLKEVESKLPKDTELPVLEETKDELSDMLRNARKYRYIDWHGIGIRNNTLSEVRKIISELKK